MRVVHIYHSGDTMLAQYVSMLTDDTSVEACSTDNPKALMQMCKERRPDLIHQHGCSWPDITNAVLWAGRQGIRIVHTPHGQLTSVREHDRIHTQKLQKLMRHAYALIARSGIEAEALEKTGWTSRIEMVHNPIITRSTTVSQLIESHHRIYQQVIDSNVLELMDDATRNAIRVLLKAGITGDERWVEAFDPQTINWRQLNIYARLEGITPIIERGLQAMGINAPEKVSALSYLPNNYKKPQSIAGKPILEQLRYIRECLKTNQLALLSLAELDMALRCDDIEDNVLMQQLRAERLDSFFAALLMVLSEQTGLDEGFMPCEPIDDNVTKNIRNNIKNHLKI